MKHKKCSTFVYFIFQFLNYYSKKKCFLQVESFFMRKRRFLLLYVRS
ncbi:hypothetical protein D931_03483 [Enterococcus faecium 13.SD.W.09]|nr:hypothetical protein D931_03483 [Enterococcus faecium 13.SD.W.09]